MNANIDEQVAEGIAAYDRNDLDVALEIFMSLAKQGNASAQNALAFCYYNGQGIAKDIKQAIDLFRKSAEQGFSRAQCNLGNFYADGEDGFIDQDYLQAAEWYLKSANQGDADAQYRLAQLYYSGKGLEKNYQIAAEWFKKAADQGDADAQYSLGLMYYWGDGGDKDYQGAAELFTKSAEQGHANSQFSIATCYQTGSGVIQDDEQAAVWMLKAAEQGHAKAQFQLAQMYENGKGVVLNAAKAKFWYECAAEQGEKKPTVADLDNHLILLNHSERQRLGYVSLVENSDLPLLAGESCFFYEIVDDQQRMPLAMVELKNVVTDFGPINSPNLNSVQHLPWLERIEQCGNGNVVTTIRAALIALGEIVLIGANEDLIAKLAKAQTQHGTMPVSWSDEEVQIVIELSKQEEARSIEEIEQRANLAKLIADQINLENQLEYKEDQVQ